MLKNRIIFFISIMIIGLWIMRYKSLNEKYPNPVEHIAHMNQELRVGDYSFKLKSWEWYDGSIIESIAPDYKMLISYDGEAYPSEKQKVVLATVEICKNVEDDTYLDLTNMAFEMGAWHNQWDIELFEALNGANHLFLDLKEGERTQIIFPIVMYEFQFHKKSWNNIETNPINIVIDCYPQKYVLQG